MSEFILTHTQKKFRATLNRLKMDKNIILKPHGTEYTHFTLYLIHFVPILIILSLSITILFCRLLSSISSTVYYVTVSVMLIWKSSKI